MRTRIQVCLATGLKHTVNLRVSIEKYRSLLPAANIQAVTVDLRSWGRIWRHVRQSVAFRSSRHDLISTRAEILTNKGYRPSYIELEDEVPASFNKALLETEPRHPPTWTH